MSDFRYLFGGEDGDGGQLPLKEAVLRVLLLCESFHCDRNSWRLGLRLPYFVSGESGAQWLSNGARLVSGEARALSGIQSPMLLSPWLHCRQLSLRWKCPVLWTGLAQGRPRLKIQAVEALVSREFVDRLAHAMKTALVDSVPGVGIVDHWSGKETEEGLVR